ncbi:putative S-adenosylmethionine decarboxylase [Cinnamomum micranthum f. kanehirae]|uniref:Putative S-adenosylmethionine decarboxylase n=1 Tax=Cinnamomum micranthum f. kanehirae TaxID=337451 RepID=A0A443NEU3_9MAGN|nr:putative S-adenosylmethionine decarboxylase [Cinnamomum micranthum f. kanehirae]
MHWDIELWLRESLRNTQNFPETKKGEVMHERWKRKSQAGDERERNLENMERDEERVKKKKDSQLTYASEAQRCMSPSRVLSISAAASVDRVSSFNREESVLVISLQFLGFGERYWNLASSTGRFTLSIVRIFVARLNDLMEEKGGKKSSNKSLYYEAPLGYSIEYVRPNGGIKKFRSAAYSNCARKPS